MLTALRRYFAGGRTFQKLMLLHAALMEVSDKYTELGRQQDKGMEWYGCGIWLPGIGREDNLKVAAAFDQPKALRTRGWASDVPSRRRCLFAQVTVQASSPERAASRCLAEVTRRLEDGGIENAEAIRVEVEALPPEWVEVVEQEVAEGVAT